MAPTKSAGRVSIRVLPDSTRFREDLKKTLDRIENSMKVNIQVNPVMDKKQLAELKRQIESLAITIRPDIDLTVPADDIARIKEQIEAMNPEVQVDMKLNTASASARIAALTRDRVMRIWPMIMGDTFKNVNKHLMAIAGMGIIAKEIDRGLKFLREIDVHAVRFGKQALIMGSVISAAAGAAQVMFALGDGLIKVTGLLTVAPALLSSLGIAAYALIVPLKNMKDELADLGPAFTDMHAAMNRKFWDQAADPIREMTNTLMPTLTEKMIRASQAMGLFTAEMARSFGANVTPERFALMFDRVLESMFLVRHAIDPLMKAFTTLGLHGTKYLSRLSMAIVRTSERFNDWIQLNDQNGNLTKWTEEAILAFKDLGGIIKGVWNVFGELNRAIKTAGGPTLADLHRGLDDMARTMSSPMFQEAMVHVFKGMNNALLLIGDGIRDIGPALAEMAPVIENVFSLIGLAAKDVIGYFGEIISHPMVKDGLVKAFEGIVLGIRALKPAIEPFSEALGSLLKLLGTVLENVGHLVATIMTEWGPSLQKLSETFDTLAEPLRVMLEDVVKALTPAIKTLVDEAIVPLLEWVRDHLIPAVGDFADDIGPGLKTAMETLGDAIDAVLPTLTKITDFFTKSDDEASDFKKTLDNISLFFNDPESFVNKSFDGEISFDPDDLFPTLAEDLAKRRDEELEKAAEENRGAGPAGAWNKWITDFVFTIGENLAEEWDKIEWVAGYEKADKEFLAFGDKLQEWAARFGREVKYTYKDINRDLEDFWGDLGDSWDDLQQGFSNWIGWPSLELKAQSSFAKAEIAVNNGIDTIKRAWENFTSGELTWGEVWNGLGEALGIDMENLNRNLETGWNTIVTKGEEIIGGFTEWFGTTWDEAVAADKQRWDEFDIWLNEKWTGMTEWGAETWTTFSNNLGEIWGGIKEGVKTKLDEMGVDQTNAWTIMWGTAMLGWDTIKLAVQTKVQEMRDGLKTKLDEMGVDQSNAWTIMWGVAGVGWDVIKTTVQTKVDEMRANLKTKLDEMGIDQSSSWTIMTGLASRGWDNIKAAVKQALIDMLNAVGLNGEEIVASMGRAWERAKQEVKRLAEQLVQGAKDTINKMIEDLRNLPGKMANAITSGGSLSGSGSSLMSGFVGGLWSQLPAAESAARNIMARVRSFFPSSPAKRGPFSGKGWTPYSGAAVVDGFAEGMASRMSNAQGVARKLHTGVSKELNSITGTASWEDGASGSGGNVTVKVYNPVAEPSSRTIAKASSLIKLGGKL